jgi:predicted nuclease of predicted toxin-antitoxin system
MKTSTSTSRALRRLGIDVLTAQDDNHNNTPDAIVLDRATALGRILFSQDDDLLREAHQRQTAGEAFLGVIYAHQLKVAIGQCVQDLELIAAVTDYEEWTNRVMYLPLR